jgi:hypothetical protein
MPLSAFERKEASRMSVEERESTPTAIVLPISLAITGPESILCPVDPIR